MKLITSPFRASCQLEKDTVLHFLCVCTTLAILRTRIFGKPLMNASEFAEVLEFSILRFVSQIGRFGTNL
jgi:hypothetical protein